MDAQFKDYWDAVLKQLSEAFTNVTYETLFKHLEPLNISDGYFTVYAPAGYIKDTVEHRYHKQIEGYLHKSSGLNFNLRFVAEKNLHEYTKSKRLLDEAVARSHLNSKYMFSNFVRGKSNELAYAASAAVAEKPGVTKYNPLFIYGGVGLGKTHLMHSIGNFILSRDIGKCVLYTTTENFTNEFIDAILKNKNQAFRNKYRDIDVLLLDDIQFMSKKESTQDELFHTFNTLYEANKQIVITSDQPPKELKEIEERLTSRFGNGLIIDITLPDLETRTAILEKKAEQEGMVISKDITQFIASSIVSNIRELEGALTKIMAFAKLGNSPITMSIAERELKAFITEKDKHSITIDYITEICAKYFGVSIEDMKSKRRTQNIVYPRQIAMYLCRKLADAQSLPIIGKFFGGRDHTTVIYSCDKIASELETDLKLKNVLMDLERIIKGVA